MRIFSDEFQSLFLTPVQKLIYVFLSSISDESGFVSISTNEIAKRVGCSRVSVSNSLSHLDSLSLIRVYRGSSIGELSSYSVLDPFVDNYREVQKPKVKESSSEYFERMEIANELARKSVAEFQRERELMKQQEDKKPGEATKLNSTLSPGSNPSQSKRLKNRNKRKKKGKK